MNRASWKHDNILTVFPPFRILQTMKKYTELVRSQFSTRSQSLRG